MSFKNPFTILRIGLGLVFLANAWTAWFAPDEFKDLIGNSFLLHLFPAISVSAFLMFVRISDSLLALIFLINFKPIMKYALIWASIWILGVMITIWDPIDGLEHLGLLSMSLALLINSRQGKS